MTKHIGMGMCHIVALTLKLTCDPVMVFKQSDFPCVVYNFCNISLSKIDKILHTDFDHNLLNY